MQATIARCVHQVLATSLFAVHIDPTKIEAPSMRRDVFWAWTDISKDLIDGRLVGLAFVPTQSNGQGELRMRTLPSGKVCNRSRGSAVLALDRPDSLHNTPWILAWVVYLLTAVVWRFMLHAHCISKSERELETALRVSQVDKVLDIMMRLVQEQKH
eukprot:6482143-Amphidinium_carterae.1